MMIGRTLGNYRIIEQIGMGGMATVYKAYDPGADRYVAVKILPEQFSQDPTFRERFQREAKAIARLEHLHILPLFAYGEADGIAYMVMRYLKAGTLTDRIKQGPLPLNEASRFLSQIASALDHAHAHDVLHRDVKPSNVLLDVSGNAFLTDFGIAKMVEATLDLTQGGLLGTPAYMSPEQCRGSTELTPASDIYSLGIVLYEMVSGRTPFQAETPIALIHMQLNEPLPPPRQLRPDLPEAGERVILKALAKEPELRYQTCGAMADTFDQAIAQEAAVGPTLPHAERETIPHIATESTAVTPASQRRLSVWVVGLVGLLVIVGLIVGAMATGLIPLGQEVSTLEIGEAPNAPTTVAEAEEELPATPEPPTVRPNSTPSRIFFNRQPTNAKEVSPCVDAGLGPGLCIYPWDSDTPTKILEGAELEFTGPASWSPDGKQIAFSAIEPGEDPTRDSTIYIVNADGSDLTELPTNRNDNSPVWSPDGDWLAFHSSCDLVKMRPNGSSRTVLWRSTGNLCSLAPQWYPDGRLIVFSAIPVGDLSFPMVRHIYSVTREGSEGQLTDILTIHHDETCIRPEVAFSPDGLLIAYIDEDCRPFFGPAGFPNEKYMDSVELPKDFPIWWTGSVYPQWGGLGRERVESEASSKTQGALCLDGQSGYVEIPFSESLNLAETLTLEAWVNVDAFPLSQCDPWGLCGLLPVISQGHAASSAGNYTLGIQPDSVVFAFEPIDSKLVVPGDLGTAWNHLAVVHTFGDSAATQVYHNGVRLTGGGWTNDFGNFIDGNEPAHANSRSAYAIGRMLPQNKLFAGCLDEVRIWNIARTGEEIQATMNRELAGDEEGLVGYWTFNEPADTKIARDLSLDGHDGWLRGGTQIHISNAPVQAQDRE